MRVTDEMIQIKSTDGTVLHRVEADTLCYANLRSAYLSGADLRRADLRGADLRRADLIGADLSDADLSDADLIGAYLSDANLCDANLCDATLSRADLSGANLRGADLRRADLIGANLRRADLRGADLRGADLRGALIADGVRLTGERPICTVGPIGSRDGTLFGFRTDRGPYVRAGCWIGTIEDFRARVATTHKNTRHRRDYDAACNLLAVMLCE